MNLTMDNNLMVRDLLEQERKINLAKLDNLIAEYRSLLPAYRFMNLIIDTLKQHASLQDEWLAFLEIAGIPEPDFKSEYLSTSVWTNDGN